jgi:pimeloyl-ACP methyl ester carboxylesterase
MDEVCIAEAVMEAQRPYDDIVRRDPAVDPAWRAALDAQRVGELTTGVPALLLHGTADEIIPVEDSRELLERLCAGGTRARLVERNGQNHGVQPEPELSAWIADRFARRPAPTDC